MAMNTLGTLNDFLFEELERLNELDVSDAGAVDSEVARAKAMGSMARAINENAGMVLDSVRMRMEMGAGGASVPKMLEG